MYENSVMFSNAYLGALNKQYDGLILHFIKINTTNQRTMLWKFVGFSILNLCTEINNTIIQGGGLCHIELFS